MRLDYFTIIGDYIPLLELLDGGGWVNGVEVKKFQERTIDFRIRSPDNSLSHFSLLTPVLSGIFQGSADQREPVPRDDLC